MILPKPLVLSNLVASQMSLSGLGCFSISDFPERVVKLLLQFWKTNAKNQLISEIWKLFNHSTRLVKVYKEKSLILDKQVTFEQLEEAYTGVAKSGDKGQLLVLTDDGQEKWLSAGEVVPPNPVNFGCARNAWNNCHCQRRRNNK